MTRNTQYALLGASSNNKQVANGSWSRATNMKYDVIATVCVPSWVPLHRLHMLAFATAP